MVGLTIRGATSEDARTFAAIEIATKRDSLPHLIQGRDLDAKFWTGHWHKYLFEGSSAQDSLRDGYGLLADRGGRPVGFAAYHHSIRHGADAELQAIYVLKEAQRQGVGTALLRAVGARLVADGSISLCVGYDPRNPYKKFYVKQGAIEINPHWAVWWDVSPLAEAAPRRGR